MAVPIAFGAMWAVDASLNWEPAFEANPSHIVSGADKGKPITETSPAVAPITEFGRKLADGLFVWSVARGFRGPYMPGTATDAGAAIVYSLVFWALWLVDAGRMSIDRLISARASVWRRISG